MDAGVFAMNTETATVERSSSSPRWIVFGLCWLGGIFAGMDANLFSLVLPQAVSELVHSTDRTVISQIGSSFVSLFLCGWMLGGMLFGIFSDRYGRITAMACSVAVYSLFTGIAGIVESPWQMAVCRFLTGLGVGGEMLCISVYLAEVWPTRSRALALGALITSYQVGVLLSGVIAQLFAEWRAAFLVCSLPIMLCGIVYRYLSESPVWLASQTNQIERVKPTPFDAANRRNLLIGSLAFGGLLIAYWASLAWIPTWIQDLLNGTSSGHEKNTATILHALCAIVGCMVAGPLVTRFGRLPVIATSFAGALITSALMFLTHTVFSQAIYWEHSALGLFVGLAQATMYIYLPELFATEVRATSVGFCLNCGRMVTAVAVLFMGALVPWFGGYSQAMLTFACFYVAGFIPCLLGKETGHLPK
jgi:MFS family permease